MKKIICDRCGKECTRWYEVVASPWAKYSWMNISDMLLKSPCRQFCVDCFRNAFNGEGGKECLS